MSDSIIDAAAKLDLPLAFKTTKKSKVPGNSKLGGVARKKTRIQYRRFLHRKVRKVQKD